MGKRPLFFMIMVFLTSLLIVEPSANICVAQEGVTKTLRIGAIMPLSGKGATLGIPFNNTLIMQAEQYNKAGGIKVGKDNYKIELIIEDSRYTAEGGKMAADKLIFRDKVKYILGPVISPACILLNPITNENKVLVLNNGSSPKNIGREYTYTFRPYLTSQERMPSQYKWIKENLTNVKRIGTIDINDETGHATTAAIRRNAEKHNFELCDPVFFPRGASDYYPLMTKLLTMKPDYIDLGSAALGEVALEVKAARQLGFKGYMSMSFPQDVSELCKIAGKENAEGFIFGDTLIAEALPGTREFKNAYVARWKDWDPYTLKWSVYLPILTQGLMAAGTTEDTTKVRDTIEKMQFDTPMGRIRWSGAKTYGIAHQMYTPYGLSVVKNCELVSLGVLPAEKVIEAMGEK